jgi:hypothetical protein
MARQVWREIGDPVTLEQKDKLYCIDNLSGLDIGFMAGSVPSEGRLPLEVKQGSSVERILPVADDLDGLRDQLESLRLRVRMEGIQPGDTVTIKMNGEAITPEHLEEDWLTAEVAPSVMHRGQNRVAVSFEGGESQALTLSSVELEVQYKQ